VKVPSSFQDFGNGGFRNNSVGDLGISVMKTEKSLQDYVDERVAPENNIFEGNVILTVRERKEVEINGEKGVWLDTYVGNGLAAPVLETYISTPGNYLVHIRMIWFDGELDHEEMVKNVFNQILSTFRFVEGEKSIQEIDFASYFSSIPPYSDCDEVAPSLSAVFVNNIEYFDVTDDGREEAIVIASSCYTHTAGPDIVGVYQANLDGEIQPLEFKESLQSHLIRWNPNKQVLIGFTGAYEAGDRNCCPSKEKIVEYQWDNNIQRFRILSEETRERVHRNKAFWDDDCYIDTVAC